MNALFILLAAVLIFMVVYGTYLAEQVDFKQFTYQCNACRQDPDRISKIPQTQAETTPICKRCGRPMDIIQRERLF